MSLWLEHSWFIKHCDHTKYYSQDVVTPKITCPASHYTKKYSWKRVTHRTTFLTLKQRNPKMALKKIVVTWTAPRWAASHTLHIITCTRTWPAINTIDVRNCRSANVAWNAHKPWKSFITSRAWVQDSKESKLKSMGDTKKKGLISSIDHFLKALSSQHRHLENNSLQNHYSHIALSLRLQYSSDIVTTQNNILKI